MVSKNSIEKLYENRIIRIDVAIDDALAADVCSDLLAMDDDAHSPVMLYINSPGGSVSAGLEIIDHMNTVKSPVFTVNTAVCASMAAVILSNGSKRMSLPHATVMLHEVSSQVQGKYRDMKSAFEHTEAVNKVAMTLLAENCGKTYDQLMHDAVHDMWLSAEVALDYGIIDEITGNKKRTIWTPEDSTD